MITRIASPLRRNRADFRGRPVGFDQPATDRNVLPDAGFVHGGRRGPTLDRRF